MAEVLATQSQQSKQMAEVLATQSQQSKQLAEVLATQSQQSKQSAEVLATQSLQSEQLARQSEQLGEVRAAQVATADNLGALVEVAAADSTTPRGSPDRPRGVSAERLHELVAPMRPVLGGDDADALALRCVRTLCDDVAVAETVRHVPLVLHSAETPH